MAFSVSDVRMAAPSVLETTKVMAGQTSSSISCVVMNCSVKVSTLGRGSRMVVCVPLLDLNAGNYGDYYVAYPYSDDY